MNYLLQLQSQIYDMTKTITFNLYKLTWNRLVKELNNSLKIILRTVCKTNHTDYNSMNKCVYMIKEKTFLSAFLI